MNIFEIDRMVKNELREAANRGDITRGTPAMYEDLAADCEMANDDLHAVSLATSIPLPIIKRWSEAYFPIVCVTKTLRLIE